MHAPPALLVAAVLDCAADGGECRLQDGLDRWQLVEAATQAAAVVRAAWARQAGGTGDATVGVLVGCQRIDWYGEVDASAELVARVSHAGELGALHAFTATMLADDVAVCEVHFQVHHGAPP